MGPISTRISKDIETCRTKRDLYQRLVASGAHLAGAGRTLDEFLRAWWRVGHLIAGRETLDLTTVAVMIATHEGVRRRTGFHWYNFDVKSYLECGMAVSLGGWDEDDGERVPVSGPSVPLKAHPDIDGERILPSLTWTDLADIAINVQQYE